MDYNIPIVGMLVTVGLLGFGVWGLWELIDWLFIADVIKSENLIKPSIELIIEENKVDTIYVYKK